jgi:hypothetical protein
VRAPCRAIGAILTAAERSDVDASRTAMDFLGAFLLRFLVDDGFRNFRQGRVCVLFFLQRRVEKPYGISKTQLIGPRFQSPVAGYFVMLDSLRACQKACIERR